MNLNRINKLLILLQSHGVYHFKSLEIEVDFRDPPDGIASYTLKIDDQNSKNKKSDPPIAAAVLPVEVEIPHHVNEVMGLLKLSDEQLVDKMFPDYSQVTNAD